MKLISKIKTKIWSIFFKNARLSYSQCGEDMILDTIFCNFRAGVYIDVGANHPFIASSTQYFYQKGWRGINIDALPGSMDLFKKNRPKDINIEAAISNEETELTYYMFRSTSFNTFVGDRVEEIKLHTQLIDKKKIKTIKLAKLLDSQKIQKIDFMSVDVEGMDLNVLKSNNWIKYRPKIVLTEFFSKNLDLIQNDEVYQFLINKGYKFLCNTPTNAYYIENDYFKERFEG